MRRLAKMIGPIALASAALVGHAETGRTFLVRNRSFTPGAPAGWTTNEFRGTAGSDVVNAQSAAARSVLRVSGPDSNDPYPNEPNLTLRGSLADWANASQQVLDEKAELERSIADLGSSFRELDAKIQNARAEVEVRRLRLEFLDEAVRSNRIEAARAPTPENKTHLANLTAQDARAQTALLRSEMTVGLLNQQREVSLKGQHDQLNAALEANAKRANALAGFYAGESIRGVAACAKPWVYKYLPGTSSNPFYPAAQGEASLGRQTLAVCVSTPAQLQAVYLMNAEGGTVARSLFGRNARGELDRIVIRDERGLMLEDHQYLPGPKGTVRYGLTFRTEGEKGKSQMTSIYTDLPAR